MPFQKNSCLLFRLFRYTVSYGKSLAENHLINFWIYYSNQEIIDSDQSDSPAEVRNKIEIINISQKDKSIDAQINEIMGSNHEEQLNSYPSKSTSLLPNILIIGNTDPSRVARIFSKSQRKPASMANSNEQQMPRNSFSDLTQKAKPLPEQRRP